MSLHTAASTLQKIISCKNVWHHDECYNLYNITDTTLSVIQNIMINTI